MVDMVHQGGWDVFVSYGHEDAEWVGVLAANLHRAGFDVFLDVWEIAGGDRFVGRLEEGLRGSKNGVLVVSPGALSRPWVREEYHALLRTAVEDPGRRLIPVLLADAELPVFLASRSWVDFRTATTGPAYDDALEQLVRALRGQAPQDRPERDSAREWPGGASFRAAGPVALRLRIAPGQVSLWDGGRQVAAHEPDGLRRSTVEAIGELLRRRALGQGFKGSGMAVADVGRRLTVDFLAGQAGAELAARVEAAERHNTVVELGLEIVDDALADLPWETLQLPGPDGPPLVLHRNLAVYRSVPDLGPTPAYKIRGPLRILAVIASPEANNEAGELLNYEAELARIVAVVDAARHRGGAYVRMVRYGTVAAVREALTEEPEGFHVLHLSCHAQPGRLILEDDDGGEDLVDARRFLEEAVPAGTALPLVVLSGCSTGLTLRHARRGGDDEGEQGEQALASFARQLVERGAAQVLAMQAPVSDAYATELTAAVYAHLANAPDALVAVAEARRACERARAKLPEGSPRRELVEWATPTLLVRGPRLPLFNRREPFAPVAVIPEPVLDPGVVVRRVGEFVSRRRPERDCRRILTGGKAGLVIHGIGGVGKSSLAAELVRALGGLVVSKAGTVSVDAVLDEVGAQLLASLVDDQARRDAVALRRADVEWTDRWRELVRLAAAVPMVVLLDNFEDNLVADDGSWRVRDGELAALLARWVRQPGRSRLLFTCRHPFELPDGARRRLGWHHLGPLSVAETAKLMWQLPGLDALTPEERERAWRDVGGHPRTLEYLDALLRGGQARFDDVAERMEEALARRGIHDPQRWMAAKAGQVDAALAEAVTLAVDDVVLSDLLAQLDATPLAVPLVVAASVYRIPVDDAALICQIGMPDGWEAAARAAEAAGLLTPVRRLGGQVQRFVHRWTAATFARLYPQEVKAAHHTAARYWRQEVENIDQLIEARYPHHAAGELDEAIRATNWIGSQLHIWGQYGREAALCEQTSSWLPAASETAAGFAHQLGVIAQERGDYTTAEMRYDQALQIVERFGDQAGMARSFHELGRLAQDRSDYETAEARYHEALQIAERLGDQAGMARCYHNLGVIARDRGDHGTAETRYREALEIVERLGDQAFMARSCHELGRLAQDRGDYETAEARYYQAREIFERLGDQAGLAASHGQLGMFARDRGDFDTAETRLHQAREIFERLGNQPGMATTYRNLGRLAQDRGDYETAETRYYQAREIFERLGNPAEVARSYSALGMLRAQTGALREAVGYQLRALAIRLRLGTSDTDWTVTTLVELRRTLGTGGFLAAVREHVDEDFSRQLMKWLDDAE